MTRRVFLKGASALTIVAAGGSVWRAGDQGVLSAGRGAAYEPWASFESDADAGPLGVVRAGILASNPHNTQPWTFRVTDSTIELYADTWRNLGAFDPFLREMHLGLGCAVENMAIAARALGFVPHVSLADGRLPVSAATAERIPAARIELLHGGRERDELYDAIPRRHTNRGPYDPNRPVARYDQAHLASAADTEPRVGVILFGDGPQRQALGQLIIRATEAIIADEAMVADSERWYRHRWSDIQEHRDGVTLDAAGLSPATTLLGKMQPRPSARANHAYWLDATRHTQVPTAPLLGLIVVRDLYETANSLQAGRVWQRMHLRATQRGIAMQPLNQPVEVVDRESELGAEPRMSRALEAFAGASGWKPTFAFRAGHALRRARPSPRRGLEQVVASDGVKDTGTGGPVAP